MKGSKTIIEIKVEGMTCGGCVCGVTNALNRVDADAVVIVDLAGKTVSVESIIDAQQLKQAIESAGFQVS